MITGQEHQVLKVTDHRIATQEIKRAIRKTNDFAEASIVCIPNEIKQMVSSGVRHICINAHNLSSHKQLSLWDKPSCKYKLQEVIHTIDQKFGQHCIQAASKLGFRESVAVIAPSWRAEY